MRAALLLIDLQNDFCPGGSLAVTEGDRTIPVALRAMAFAEAAGWPIVATQDWHPANHGSFASNAGTQPGECGELNGLFQVWWPDHCIQNSHGADFHPDLDPSRFSSIIHKGTDPAVDSYSAFFDNGRRAATALHGWLQQRNIGRLVIMGLATDYCVKYSVLDALQLGYQVEVITEGCRGVNLQPQDSQAALEEMRERGAILQTLDTLTFSAQG